MTTDINKGSNLLGAEGRAGSGDNICELGAWDLILPDKFGNDLSGQVGVGKVAPGIYLFLGDGGIAVWDEETPVVGQPPHDHVPE